MATNREQRRVSDLTVGELRALIAEEVVAAVRGPRVVEAPPERPKPRRTTPIEVAARRAAQLIPPDELAAARARRARKR